MFPFHLNEPLVNSRVMAKPAQVNFNGCIDRSRHAARSNKAPEFFYGIAIQSEGDFLSGHWNR
jgi:hypothetical protein